MLFMAVAIAFTGLTGCALDNYDQVPEKTERVVLKRPHAFFRRTVGGFVNPEPLMPGQRNHGNGPTLAYDWDMSIQQRELKLEVLMRERINQPFRLAITFQVIPGRTVDGSLNFMPPYKLICDGGNCKYQWVEPSTFNSVQVVKVPLEYLYDNLIFPFFDMAARDVIDGHYSRSIQPGPLGEQILERTKEILSQVRQPRISLNANGVPQLPQPISDFSGGGLPYSPEDTIGILDVVDVKAVQVLDYSNPDPINDAINEIGRLKGKAAELEKKLDGMATKREIARDGAAAAKAVSDNLREQLAKNPRMFRLKMLEMFRDMQKGGEGVPNTDIIFCPKDACGNIRIEVGRPNS
jgi:hypothetical protein